MNNRPIDIDKDTPNSKMNFLIKEVQKIDSKLNAIYHKIGGQTKEEHAVSSKMKTFAGLTVPSYIPDISGKQIYKMNKLGWSKEQICAISGFSPEEAQKKYDTYVRNNV